MALEYSPAIANLLENERLMPLDPGTPNEGVELTLRESTLETLFAPYPVVDRDMAMACLAGLWLYHDFLEEAHSISQSIGTREGSYWHAIMHRREQDYSNSKYWYRRVGEHRIFPQLHFAAQDLVLSFGQLSNERAIAFVSDTSLWNPLKFVDLCELGSTKHGKIALFAQQVQMAEWRLLFDHCNHAAVGRA